MLEYFVPIECGAELDGDFTINGIAINETTTSNGHKFLGEELAKSANTLIGVPLLKDHNNSVDSIVGKVNSAHFDDNLRSIPFKAVVKDEKMKKLIKDGLLNTVSVGAQVDPANIEELENGDIIPRGITFKELSLVAVPADSGATFGIALTNAWNKIKSNSYENLESVERRNDIMAKENLTILSEDQSEEPKVEEVEAPEEKEDVSEKILATLSAMDKRLAKLEASDVDEEPEAPKEEKEEEEPEEAEESEEEEVEEKGDYKITQSHNSFGIERKSYNYN